MQIVKLINCVVLFCAYTAQAGADEITTTAKSNQPNPKLTAAIATQLAADFCQRIGAPVTAPATVSYPAPDQAVGQMFYWQKRWRVIFKDQQTPQATVEVVDDDRSIAWYENNALFPPGSSNKNLHQATISEATAIQRSKDAIDAAGNGNELAFLQKSSMRPSLLAEGWLIEWHRVYGQIPYRLMWCNIVLDDQTGALKSLVKVFVTPSPKDVHLKFTPDDAFKVATQQFAARKLETVGPTRIQLEVVQPNRLWEPGGKEEQTQPLARVAWTCFSQTKAGFGLDVWMDTETGEVIGGNADTPPDIAPPEDMHVPDSELPMVAEGTREPLMNASEIKVTPLSAETEQEKFRKTQGTPPSLTPEQIPTPLVTFSVKTDAAMLQNFKTQTRFTNHQVQLVTDPDLQFIVPGAYKNEYTYYAKLGIIVLPASFIGIVSDEFRDWLNTKLPK